MKRFTRLLFLGFIAVTGCNQCGDRPKLFSRRDHSGDTHNAPLPCPEGQAVGRGTGYGNLPPGYATGSVSGPIYTGPSYPSYPTYPAGDPLPYPSAPGRSDELPPPGSYIPSPGVPSAPYAIPRSIESGKAAPKAGGLTTSK